VDDSEEVSFTDDFAGEFRMNVNKCLGDFPLARDKNGAGYTLAVVVDDAEMGVTEVVRGDDLLSATPQQILLYRALGLKVPSFFHVPLVVGRDGRRLAKRHGDTRITSFKEQGVSAECIIGYLAHTLGIIPQIKPVKLYDLVDIFDEFKIPSKPLVYDLHL
jgi:glutamyl-tRNA synthetase